MPAKLPGKHEHVNVYFAGPLIDEIKRECRRTDRPLNWIMRRVWEAARAEIKRIPAKDPQSPRPQG